jgi:hypothetical protein
MMRPCGAVFVRAIRTCRERAGSVSSGAEHEPSVDDPVQAARHLVETHPARGGPLTVEGQSALALIVGCPSS